MRIHRFVLLALSLSNPARAFTRLIVKGGGTFSAQYPAQTDVTLNDRSLSSGYLGGLGLVSAGLTSKPPLQLGLAVDAFFVERAVLDTTGARIRWQGWMIPAQLYFEWSPIFWSVGGYYARILKGKFRANGSGMDPSALSQSPEDYGLTAGLGVNIGSLVLEFRASRGFHDVKTDGIIMTSLFVDTLIGVAF